MRMKPLVLFIGGLLGLAIGFIAGGLFGMNLFGNYFVHVTFFGNRGYEAGFWIVGIAGGILGAISGVALALGITGWAQPGDKGH